MKTGRHKSKEQKKKKAISNIETPYKAGNAVINFFDDYSIGI